MDDSPPAGLATIRNRFLVTATVSESLPISFRVVLGFGTHNSNLLLATRSCDVFIAVVAKYIDSIAIITLVVEAKKSQNNMKRPMNCETINNEQKTNNIQSTG